MDHDATRMAQVVGNFTERLHLGGLNRVEDWFVSALTLTDAGESAAGALRDNQHPLPLKHIRKTLFRHVSFDPLVWIILAGYRQTIASA